MARTLPHAAIQAHFSMRDSHYDRITEHVPSAVLRLHEMMHAAITQTTSAVPALPSNSQDDEGEAYIEESEAVVGDIEDHEAEEEVEEERASRGGTAGPEHIKAPHYVKSRTRMMSLGEAAGRQYAQ
jgi:hypothetical protein